MIKYQFTIIAIFSVAEGETKKLLSLNFTQKIKIQSKIIKESPMKTYFSSSNYCPNPRQATDLIEFLN